MIYIKNYINKLKINIKIIIYKILYIMADLKIILYKMSIKFKSLNLSQKIFLVIIFYQIYFIIKNFFSIHFLLFYNSNKYIKKYLKIVILIKLNFINIFQDEVYIFFK